MAHLGDRVKIHSLTIENEMIVVDLTTQGPGDPMCCPNRREVQRFVTENNRLVQVTKIMDEKADHALIGTLWQWQQTLYNNDTKAVPPDSTRYTLKLLPDGRLSIRADCNSGGGKYLLRGSEISLEITHSTLATCPPGSLESIFIQNLKAAAIYFIEGDQLYIDLKNDSGTMRFAR
jgi:heat shock protein HslJ